MEQKNENSKIFIERLSKFIDYKEDNFSNLAKGIGLSNSYFSKMNKNSGSLGIEIVIKIVKYYDTLNADWLLTGRGEMLRNSFSSEKTENKTIEHLNYLIDRLKEENEQLKRSLPGLQDVSGAESSLLEMVG